MKRIATALRRSREWFRGIRVRRHAALLLVILEGLLTAVPFLISWWVSATYKAVLAGWTVSGMKTSEKRKALRSLMGEADDAG